MAERNDAEIGALWAQTSGKGVEYLSGTVNGVKVVCFRNAQKQGKQPDWRVMKSRERDAETPSRRYDGHANEDY